MPSTEHTDPIRTPSRELADEMAQNPTRDQWEAALGKWRGRADLQPLLEYGTRKGWFGDH